MKQDELRALASKLADQGKMRFLEGATEEQIRHFEEAGGFVLPKGFRAWLAFSDGGCLFLPGGVQLYGVARKPLIDVHEEDRPDERFLVIGALSSGDPILAMRNSEEICIYNHEAGRIEADERFPDFCAFLNALPELLGIGG